METYETICRLCLKMCQSFKAIEGNIKDVLHTLLPKIDLARDLTIVQKPVVCSNCADMLMKCFDFKSMCLYTHDYIAPFVNKDSVKLDLKDVYLSQIEYSAGIVEGQDICGFCIRSVQNCFAISLNVEKEDVLMEKMIKRCLPELDLRIIEKPVICEPCHRSLEDFFHFVTNCLTVEEKIKKNCETLVLNNTGQVELSRLLQFTMNEVDDSIGIIAKEGVEYKIESFMGVDHKKFYNEGQIIPKNMLAYKEENNNLDMIKIQETFCGDNGLKRKNRVEMVDQTLLLKKRIEIETDEPDFIRSEDSDILSQLEADVPKSYNEQTLPSKNISAVTTYQCAFCSFQTKHNQHLKNHVLKRCEAKTKGTMFKCDICSYQAKTKYSFKQHLLVHKSPSEVIMYKCDSCSYQTTVKGTLKRHLLLHRSPSEVIMHKCDLCSFQTKNIYHFKRHLILHKSPSEVIIYKCDLCSFQTRYKYRLNEHLTVHKSPSEMPLYKCDSCLYQTVHKSNLKKHMRIHTKYSELPLYKCDSCSYQTDHKGNLKTHMLIHKNLSEVTSYKCDYCSFQSNYKGNLKTHLLKHMNPTEVSMYKCDSCSFQSLQKGSLKAHLLMYKNPTEVTMYKCDSCSFQTKYKCGFKKHLSVHKNVLT